MRGKWAQGLRPRNFVWVMTDRFAVSQRPGGYAHNHRKVRRQEELLWIRGNEFTHVVSLLDGPHNLQAYVDMEIPYVHTPLRKHDDMPASLQQIYVTVAKLLDDPQERILMHDEEFGDRLAGVLTGFLLYNDTVPSATHATQLVEKLTKRVLGPEGRQIVQVTVDEQIRRAG